MKHILHEPYLYCIRAGLKVVEIPVTQHCKLSAALAGLPQKCAVSSKVGLLIKALSPFAPIERLLLLRVHNLSRAVSTIT